VDLPWDISPVFFRPDVLIKYKGNSEKYTLEEDSISCRNAWYLKTFGINEEGQVHTYLSYLADLPYEEQLYWQSFNEWPKAPISSRAHTTDILGEWDESYDALQSLKAKIQQLDESPPAWWKQRGDGLCRAVRYPVTDASEEWGNEILALDQMLIEGFLPSALKQFAESSGQDLGNKPLGSIKLLAAILVGSGIRVEDAKETLKPFEELHLLRTKVKGHATSEKRTKEQEARTAHGSLREHFISLTKDCDLALGKLLHVLKDLDKKSEDRQLSTITP
jgi:hypothetical protein